MAIQKKKRISLFSKILIITESMAVIVLLLLCTYKNGLPIVENIMGETKPDVVLDAGHGGFDIGTAYNDVYEKDINLKAVKYIGAALESEGYHVQYIRDSDHVDWADNERDDLRYRTNISNKSGAKLFLSIHVNSEEYDYGTSGFESWTTISDPLGVALSENMLQEVDTLGYTDNRGIQYVSQAPIYVITANKLPAVLFELGFIGSENDQRYLCESSYLKKFSEKIAQGVIKTLQDMDSSEKEVQK